MKCTRSRIFMIALMMVISISVTFGVEEYQCGDLEVRSYKSLDRLTNCTAILGNLTIVFPSIIEPYADYTEQEINNRSFPLREVVGYMFVYGVTHLNSLYTMFPNLTVIRGQSLISHYSLVIYDADIREISLRSLLKITRGSVRIGGINPRLCLPTKIDWNEIIVTGNFVGENDPKTNCTWFKSDKCHSCLITDKCWHNLFCQRTEQSYAPSKYRKKVCHPECLGDCVDNDLTARGCYTCRDIRDGPECVEQCPENKILDEVTRRCVTTLECKNSNKSVHERRCLQVCPPGYTSLISDMENTHVCAVCNETCPRFCMPRKIERLSHLEAMGVGCTIIIGDLEINIVDDVKNLTAELKTYLGDVEEIRGCLKITRSPPITELTFLNNLRVIEGNKRETKASIQIFENQNLQTIFNWQKRGGKKIALKYGNITIFNNIMLCPNETKKFFDILDRQGNFTDLVHNNGGKSKCAIESIETSFFVHSHDTCSIRWKDANPPKLQIFNVYIIQYVAIKSSEYTDEKTLFERDSCSSYGWHHKFIERDIWKFRPDGLLEYNLTGLVQNTNYVFTVQTYQYGANTTNIESTEHNFAEYDGAVSKIKKFTTLLNIPSRISDLKTSFLTPRSISLSWDVLENEEKAITLFYVDVFRHAFDIPEIDKRNYCLQPPENVEVATTPEPYYPDDFPLVNKDVSVHNKDFPFIKKDFCCAKCCKNSNDNADDSNVDDFVQKLIKLAEKVPRKNNEIRSEFKRLKNFYTRIQLVPTVRSTTIDNLDPFTPYTFYFHACFNIMKCSDYTIHQEITEPDKNFDRVHLHASSYSVEDRSIHINFNEPEDFNGAIISYHIEVQKVFITASLPYLNHCVTRKQHQLSGFRHSIHNLIEGEYAFRVRVNSLAGPGPFTELHSFHVNVTKQEDHSKDSLSYDFIIAGVFSAFFAAGIGSVLFYYRHRILRFIRRSDRSDEIELMEAIELPDFKEVSLFHQSDHLSDIQEFEDE